MLLVEETTSMPLEIGLKNGGVLSLFSNLYMMAFDYNWGLCSSQSLGWISMLEVSSYYLIFLICFFFLSYFLLFVLVDLV